MADEARSRYPVKWVAIAAAVVIGVVLILQNTGSVPVHWLFWASDAPLALFTIIVSALAFAAGWLIGRR